MNILVIGYGSIGKRHTGNVAAAGHVPILVRHSPTAPNQNGFREYLSIEKALATEDTIDAAIVCSPTSRHRHDALTLIANDVPFLLEKPPADDLAQTLEIRKRIKESQFTYYDLAFTLRYYPVLKTIKAFLPQIGPLYFARIAAGHYLPAWRPGVDYRTTSSASKALGGGVHIELIHEIDYCIWFFGVPEQIVGTVDKVSNLEIDSVDVCSALLQYSNGFMVEMHLDYLSHNPKRGCMIVGQNGTLEWEMDKKAVNYYEPGYKDATTVYQLPDDYDFNACYQDELGHFINIVQGKASPRVDIDVGVQAMRVVDAIARSSTLHQWVRVDGEPGTGER